MKASSLVLRPLTLDARAGLHLLLVFAFQVVQSG